MQRLEVSGAVRPLYGSLGVKGLMLTERCESALFCFVKTIMSHNLNLFYCRSRLRFNSNAKGLNSVLTMQISFLFVCCDKLVYLMCGSPCIVIQCGSEKPTRCHFLYSLFLF